MPVFDRVRGRGSQKKSAKVQRLVAALAEEKSGGWDNHMGFGDDAKIIEQLDQLGDPAAVPALLVERKELEEYLVFMQEFALQDEESQRLYEYVSDLLETTTRVIWKLRGVDPAEPRGAA